MTNVLEFPSMLADKARLARLPVDHRLDLEALNTGDLIDLAIGAVLLLQTRAEPEWELLIRAESNLVVAAVSIWQRMQR